MRHSPERYSAAVRRLLVASHRIELGLGRCLIVLVEESRAQANANSLGGLRRCRLVRRLRVERILEKLDGIVRLLLFGQ
jgi:hypothetical protein